MFGSASLSYSRTCGLQHFSVGVPLPLVGLLVTRNHVRCLGYARYCYCCCAAVKILRASTGGGGQKTTCMRVVQSVRPIHARSCNLFCLIRSEWALQCPCSTPAANNKMIISTAFGRRYAHGQDGKRRACVPLAATLCGYRTAQTTSNAYIE